MRLLALLALPLALAGCLNSGIHFGGGWQPEDYATTRTYRTWAIEVDFSGGAKPDASLLDFVKGRLNSIVQKEGIDFRLDETLTTDGNRAWSDDDLRAFAAAHQGLQTGGSQVTTHLLFLTGHYAGDKGDSKVLGVTYDHDLVVIFSDSVKSVCTTVLPILGCDASPYFRAVLVHEFGHAIGLVDHGVPMVRPHEASQCGNAPDQGHSSNQDSVMFCNVESSIAFSLFGSGGPPTDYDDDDRADLHALR